MNTTPGIRVPLNEHVTDIMHTSLRRKNHLTNFFKSVASPEKRVEAKELSIPESIQGA